MSKDFPFSKARTQTFTMIKRKKFCHQFAPASDELLSQWKEELLKVEGDQKNRSQ
jgi:hypothetical protein